MRLSVITPAELDVPTTCAWRMWQASNPALISPCFAPEFTLAVAAERTDVRIGMLHEGGRIAGLWPYQDDRGRGTPVGGGLSDHHGIICAPDTQWDWGELLRAAGLAYWTFDHLPASQAPPGATATVSPALQLAHGFEAWRRGRLDAGSRRIGDLERKARKLAREVGPLRFEPHVADPAVFETVLALKSLQCRRTGVSDFFAQGWTRALATRIWQTQTPGFAGRLSALYAGDVLVAAHLGMCSPRAWHWWFPVYVAAYGAYSPGALLLLRVAQAAAEQGHAVLDLGKGDDPYKAGFADGGLPLAEGWLRRASLASLVQGTRRRARAWWTGSPLAQPLRPLLQPFMRRARDWAAPGRP